MLSEEVVYTITRHNISWDVCSSMGSSYNWYVEYNNTKLYFNEKTKTKLYNVIDTIYNYVPVEPIISTGLSYSDIWKYIFKFLDFGSKLKFQSINKWFFNNCKDIRYSLIEKLFTIIKNNYFYFNEKYINILEFDRDLKKICYDVVREILDFLSQIEYTSMNIDTFLRDYNISDIVHIISEHIFGLGSDYIVGYYDDGKFDIVRSEIDLHMIDDIIDIFNEYEIEIKLYLDNCKDSQH